MENKLSDGILSKLEELANAAIPYRLMVSTSHGTSFKNNEGTSLVVPALMKSGRKVDGLFKFILGENETVGDDLLVNASDISGTQKLTIIAYVDNQEVAQTEITFIDVADGQKGEKGDTGPQGQQGEKGALDEEQVAEITTKIASKADQELTLEQLNALAEQMEIQKAELEARASLETLNEWIARYEQSVADNETFQKESEADLVALSQRVVEVTNDLKDKSERWSFIDNYFTVAEEGLVFGKQDSSSAIKITDDRISMFSAGQEVMYISQGVLNIENGIFSKSVQIGRYREEQHPINLDMNVMRYVG